MGKTKRGHNWNARQQRDVVVDHSEQKRIKIDLDVKESSLGSSAINDANVLVLPSKKRKTKTKGDKPSRRQLSKKERKQLQKVVDTKAKKAKRADILESLSQNQPTVDETKLFLSISEVYTQKCKTNVLVETSESGEVKVNTIKGKREKSKVLEAADDVSDSSIDTSDISTDDESEVPDTVSSANDKPVSAADNCDEEDCIVIENINDNKESKGTECVLTTENESVKRGGMSTSPETRKHTVNIPLNRRPDVQESRLKLPILSEEHLIIDAINANPVVIICGETGSGKTTQVPQFLYEAGYAHGNGIIGVTEPRRVAAVSMSKRVAMEMNLSLDCVSYQIRYEGNSTPETRIKFQTDGVLLKEVQKDFMLSKYSVIIIDEAHERSVFTDILIGLLSRIVPLRHKKGNPLKLIIMSATLRVEDFTENKRLFKVKPPVVQVESRQFPVTVHFNRRTPVDDYLEETYHKVCKIHCQLPNGGILVFVTGQQEVHTLCKKLRHTFPETGMKSVVVTKVGLQNKRRRSKIKERRPLPKLNLDNYSIAPQDEEDEDEMGSTDDEADIADDLAEMPMSDDSDGGQVTEDKNSDWMYVLPLYSLLSSDRQAKVFEPPPEGSRLCVVATNVAETSLTIPNVKYVVDTGRTKTKFYDKVTGVSTFRITWASQASANQRAGRAGRVSPGHCYRLYSSAVFNDEFEKFSIPEILRRPVDDLILQMKVMNIDRIENFPFPTSPDSEQVQAAERLLVSLGALTPPGKNATTKKDISSQITSVGKALSCFPVSARYGKMIIVGEKHGLLPYVIAIVAALSVDELFEEIQATADDKDEKELQNKRTARTQRIKKLWAGQDNSLFLGDLMILLKAVGACEYEGFTTEYCHKYGLREKAMKEIRKLRAQLTNTVNGIFSNSDVCIDPNLTPPTDLQAQKLRQIVCSGLADQVARRTNAVPDETKRKSPFKHAYYCMELEDPVYIHPSSVLHKQSPEFVLYQYIHETSHMFMKGVVAVEPEWLPVFAPYHCTFSSPEENPSPFFNQATGEVYCHRASNYGSRNWSLPAVPVIHPPGMKRYQWFAYLLLDGQVIPELKTYTPVLLSRSVTMVKPWAKLQARTESMLEALIQQQVDNKQTLITAWNENPNYLLAVYLEWLPQSLHVQVQSNWPPVTDS